MDFGKPLTELESVASTSGIRFAVESGTDECDALDNLVNRFSNVEATRLLHGVDGIVDSRHTDASPFKERFITPTRIIAEGDLVVVQRSFDNLGFLYATKNEIYSNKNGHFHHNDFIGKPYGCKIRSRNNLGYGFVYLLKPTPELWARSLNHRTQIVHELDQSQICFMLHLSPNMTVAESGTGSGAMSYSILRSIAPQGRLHTFEFNEGRAAEAQREFDRNGVSHLVTVYHRDVCGKNGQGGFHLPDNSVDAVFLDLPEPWLAIPYAAAVIKAGARIGTYSPCIEQTQQATQSLARHGFHSITTMEYRLREYYVDDIRLERPPAAKRRYIDRSPSIDQDNFAEKTKEETFDNVDRADDTFQIFARPFAMMRGHSAFLTFATAGIMQQNHSASRKFENATYE